MRIRKILGSVVKEHINHSVGKLENGLYAVGHLTLGQIVKMENQFETLDAAFEHWLAVLPISGNSLQGNTDSVLSGHKLRTKTCMPN